MSQSTLDDGRRKFFGRHIRVQLECGCGILLRDTPFRDSAKFGCSSGKGHGYNLRWVSWVNMQTGASNDNGYNKRV